MAGETGIAWTDGTVNFVIGCTKCGPGCEGCYAAEYAMRKWGIEFKPGGERRETKTAFDEPRKWQRMYDAGKTTMRRKFKDIPLPMWVFACSLSDFFDNEWPLGIRPLAWKVIRETPALLWIIVTKRLGNVPKMLPEDWDGGRNYPHVGIVATMVNQEEIDRDMPKLAALKALGVRWVGISIEPQLGPIKLGKWLEVLDWVISGGESTQGEHKARAYDLAWAFDLAAQCEAAGVPYFQKQMGSAPIFEGKPQKFKGKGDHIREFPGPLQVQQMPKVYGTPPQRLVPPSNNPRPPQSILF